MSNRSTLTGIEINEDNFAEELKIAKAEIGEDDKTKEQCLHQLREWISQNNDIENCLTDDNFLLRFLRTKKYSLFMAQQMILRFLNLRMKFDYLMNMMDFKEVKANELMSNGFLFSSPIRDSHGRRVVIYNFGKFDVQRYDNVDIGRVVSIAFAALAEDEETQILGVNHIVNLRGASGALTTLFSIGEWARLITCMEQASPLRHKEMNMLHVPAALKFLYDLSLSMLTKKFKQRFEMHDSQASLLKKVDKNCLPLEFGGAMAMADMIQLWKEELSQKRERILMHTNMKLLNDRGIVNRKNIGDYIPDSNMQGLMGCFRQLEVD